MVLTLLFDAGRTNPPWATPLLWQGVLHCIIKLAKYEPVSELTKEQYSSIVSASSSQFNFLPCLPSMTNCDLEV